MALRGINHVTLSVVDLDRSLHFYVDVLGSRARARWARGAYLEVGTLWLCLELDARAPSARSDDSHIAFSVDEAEFADAAQTIRASGATIWKDNRSEGESLYFQDPDGHKLEIHVGDLRTRLQSCRVRPYDGMSLLDREHPTDENGRVVIGTAAMSPSPPVANVKGKSVVHENTTYAIQELGDDTFTVLVRGVPVGKIVYTFGAANGVPERGLAESEAVSEDTLCAIAEAWFAATVE